MNILEINLKTSLALFKQAEYTNPLAQDFDKVKSETHKLFILDQFSEYLKSVGVKRAQAVVSWVGGGMGIGTSDVQVLRVTANDFVPGLVESDVQNSIEDFLGDVRDAMNVCAHVRKNLFNVIYDRMYDHSQYSSALTALVHTKDKRSRGISFSLDMQTKEFINLAKTVLEDEDTKLFSPTFYNNLQSLVEKNLIEQINLGKLNHEGDSNGQVFKL